VKIAKYRLVVQNYDKTIHSRAGNRTKLAKLSNSVNDVETLK